MDYTTLTSVAELANHLHDPEVVVFDCRHDLADPLFGAQAYAESHIAGARFANVDRNLSGPLTGTNGRHPLPDADVFMAWLGRMGVSNSSQVVAYDHAGGAYAARLWWLLRWVGHSRVAVLDGGWQAWVSAGRPVTQEIVEPAPGTAEFAGRPDNTAVDAHYVLGHLNSPDMILIDARANDRYHGENETLDPVAGHIPGALNRFFKANLTEQGLFKSPAELRAAFTPMVGATPPEHVIHQCGSGITACHNVLAMEIAGLKGTRLYAGSWSEWISDPSRPVTR